ncbi:hypothetical protein ABZZ79_19880 [Streptomyces sp. NPDC006458]|uniref:VMAP-C domain-containing protein n=1 Tax=Streptomyces sp. NPDC006458 TaxID=3154302 RepID=UPI0033A2FA16
METGAWTGDPEGGAGQNPGWELLLGLTDALCPLGCMEDAPGRVQFAAMLADQLQRPVDLRGVRLREDVVAMVRTALSVPGGEHVLVGVVRILEGSTAGDELDRLLAPVALPAAGTDILAGPLTQAEEAEARAVLIRGDLPARRLRDDLVDELNGLDLPTGLTPEQLLAHVLEWNTQPDGLPPAVLLVDRAARLARSRTHGLALSEWVDEWTQRAGLARELKERRSARPDTPSDPDVPRCLLVAVEPARDGSGEIVVRSWLNTTQGRWDPQPAEPATTTLEGLGGAVESALRQGARLWSVPSEPDAGERLQPPPYVEFALPYDLLNHDVAGLNHQIGDGRPLPLGLKYAVHLRSLERMRTDDAVVLQQWRERWFALRRHGVTVHGWSEPDAARPDAWQTALAGESSRTAVVLDAPTDVAALEALKAAIAEGIGLAVWDRRGVFDDERREVVTAVFASVQTPAQIPLAIHRLRANAVLHAKGPGRFLGRHIGFLWDDPTRVVDLHPADPDLAS